MDILIILSPILLPIAFFTLVGLLRYFFPTVESDGSFSGYTHILSKQALKKLEKERLKKEREEYRILEARKNPVSHNGNTNSGYYSSCLLDDKHYDGMYDDPYEKPF